MPTSDFYIEDAGFVPTDLDTDVNAWLTAVAPLHGTPRSTRITLLHDLVAGLKADGIWSKLDRLWVFAQELRAGALVDLVARSAATAVSSPTFTPSVGFTGNGSSSYINTNFNPRTGSPHLTLNDAASSFWITQRTDAAFGEGLYGQSDGSTTQMSAYSRGDGVWLNSVNDNTGATPLQASGLIISERIASSGAGCLTYYVNDAKATTNITSVGPMGNQPFFICALNGGAGSPSSFGRHTISIAAFGSSFNDAEATNLYSRFSTYMGAVAADNWVKTVGPSNVSTTRRTAVRTLIAGLMRDGVWGKLDRLWLFAAENQKSALVDLVAGASASRTGTLTFTTDRGFTGDGSTGYINSNYDIGALASQNDCSIHGWSLTAAQAASTMLVGTNNLLKFTIQPRFTDDKVYYRESDTNSAAAANTDGSGMYTASRTGATTSTIYRNGSSIGSDAGSSGSPSSAGNLTAFFGSSTYWNGQSAMLACGKGMTSTEASNFYTRLRTYMTTVGVP